MQIWIHDNKMKKIVALNNDIPDMMSYTNSSWHSYLDQATSTFDFTIPKFSNGELHEDLKLINDECFVSFYVNGSYQVFYIATLQEDDFNIQLTCNNTNLEYALEYANPFSADGAQTIEWYLNHMTLLSFAAVEIGLNEISDRKRTLTFDSQETKMNRLQSLMSNFDAEFEFKVELNKDGTYKRIVINIYQEADDTHHGIGTDRKDVVLYYSNGLKGVQVNSDKTQMFNEGEFTGKDGLNLANVEISEKNSDGIVEFYSPMGNPRVYAPLSMQRYPATMRAEGQDNWIRKDFTTEYENVNDLKAYALRTLKKYAYPLVTYTASVQSGFVSQYTDLKLGDTIRIIDKNFVGGLALEARVSEMIISFDNPANNSFVFTNYRKLDNKPSSALQTRIEQVIESRLYYRIELATTGGVTFKNNEGETIIKPSLYKGNLPWTKDVTWRWTLNSIVTDGMQYRIQARDITDTAVLTVDAFVGGNKVATTEITLTNVNDGLQGPQGPQGDEGPQGPQGDEGPQGPQGDTGNGIANTVITYGLSMSDTTEPATWSSDRPALVKGMYLWTRTVIIYTNGESTTSYQISYIPQDGDASGEIDKTKQELLEKLETVRDDSLAAVEEAKQQLVTVRDESLAAAEEAKQQVTTVANELNTAKQDFQNAVATVDTKATNVQNDLSQAKQDLASQAQKLQEQANAQSELTNRVSSVEETANGTKTSVSELSKTVAQNGKDITSVTARTKVVEDDLSGTKTTLSQVKTTADSTSQKTAILETGLDGLNAKFENLSVGATNHFLDSAFETTIQKIGIFQNGNVYTPSIDTTEKYYGYNTLKIVCNDSAGVDNPKITYPALAKLKTVQQGKLPEVVTISFWGKSNTEGMVLYTRLGLTNYESSQNVTLTTDWKRYIVHVRTSSAATNEWLFKFSKAGTVWIAKPQFEFSAIASDYHAAEEDTSSKVAEYKQNADQNYASLQTTVQNLDGTVQHNKTVADQTAQGFTTRIESLETYKSGESTRANKYFELAKTETARQLSVERTAIAKDYVAKSTYTSDVTGIRNELSATTTTANTIKTNLANYQATNDRAVASLQSSIQTANGDISSLKTKVEAVPGQITSAVSAVEGKIPTNVSTRNLILKSNDFANPHKQAGDSNTTVTSTDDYFIIKSIGYTENGWGGMSWNVSISEVKAGEEFSILMPVYIDSSINLDSAFSFELKRHNPNTRAYNYSIPTNKKDEWFNVAITFKITNDVVFDTYPFYIYLVKNGLVRIKPPMLVRGSLIPSDYQPAFEDTKSDIKSISSELKQTADGITLLATKTELSTAKNELQSGINTATNKANNAQTTANNNAQTISTHTTQISALNTGLSAKVSQSDFNTLSGRVTTAENNITAKANELSSKITSVEGKIPTTVGGRNYVLKTGDSKSSTGGKLYDLSSAFDDIADGAPLILEFDWSVTAPTTTSKFRINRVITYSDGTPDQWSNVIYNGSLSSDVSTSSGSGRYSGTFGYIPYNGTTVSSRYLNLDQTTANGTVTISNLSIRVGSLKSDWEPAPEDTAEQISSLSSELKQTADGITLLATKTEVNTAKNELQSGINTATNKANNAQSTANNNAQTISTHTTQISALNTGLSAKVSQSDFNTLSGRVTTAENNIIAKANELSSKITSVEGKIPTETGLRNYALGTGTAKTSTGGKLYDLSSAFDNIADGAPLILEFDWSVTAPTTTSKFRINRVITYSDGTPDQWSNIIYKGGVSSDIITSSGTGHFSGTFNNVTYTGTAVSSRYLNLNQTTANGTVTISNLSIRVGSLKSDWSPAPEDAIEEISSLSSEFKQTTDAIKASVSSLDNSTVKSSSLTINADGIVMKAGSSTTDVANAIGSYFAVNQNAINLFSDKINVKGSMIVDGAITGDKIKANSVDVTKIVGIDADYIKAKIEYAMIDWLKGKTITAYNDNMTIDLQNGRISFKDGSNAIYRQTPDGIHTGFMHFEAGSLGGIYAAFGATSTRQGINSKSSEFAGIRCYRVSANGDSHEAKIDKIEVIGDTVQFGHSYRPSDGKIGGGFIMDTAAFGNETPYSLNRVIKSIEALWRILHDHAKNTGYRFDDSAFISALNNEYNAWHDMHND